MKRMKNSLGNISFVSVLSFVAAGCSAAATCEPLKGTLVELVVSNLMQAGSSVAAMTKPLRQDQNFNSQHFLWTFIAHTNILHDIREINVLKVIHNVRTVEFFLAQWSALLNNNY